MSLKKNKKGEIAEEALRQYFLSLGFFVSRNVKFWFRSYEVTDVDLYLYIKKTTIIRDRINVDIKRRRTPQAIERIFWTKGLKQILGFDNCMVATTDKRNDTREFGAIHGVMVLDGKALDRIIRHYQLPENLMTEEDLVKALNFPTIINPKTKWIKLYEQCKQDLLINFDFNGFNKYLNYAKMAVDEYLVSHNNSVPALRFLYITISFMLLALDFKSRHLAHLDSAERRKVIGDGCRYGEAGKQRANEILETAIALAEHVGNKDLFTQNTLKGEIERQLTTYPADNLAYYFSKSDIMKSLFNTAKQFHSNAFLVNLKKPSVLETELKSILGLLADTFQIDRKNLL